MIGLTSQTLFFLFSSHLVLGSFLKQAWQAPNDYIPVEEIRKNCARGPLNEVTILLDLKHIHTLCTESNPNDNVDLVIPAIKRRVASCYSDPNCTHVVWSRRLFSFNCPNVEMEAIARESFNLTIKTTCDVTTDLKYVEIINNTITSSRQRLCPGGYPPRINHIFAMNPCPMPMRSQRIRAVNTETQDSLYRIAKAMDECGTSCQPIDLRSYTLQKLSCDGKTEVQDRGIGLYYTCNLNSTYITPSTIPSGTPSVTPVTTPSTTPSARQPVTPSTTLSVTPATTPSTSPSATQSVTPPATPSVTQLVTPATTPSTPPSATKSVTPQATPSAKPFTIPSTPSSATESVILTMLPSATRSTPPSATQSATQSVTPLTTSSVTPSTTPSVTQLVTPSATQSLTSSATSSTAVITSLSAIESETSKQQFNARHYLDALIVMSVLFALCLILLAAVLIFFLRCRGQCTNISLPVDDGPPSRQVLYSYKEDESQDGRPLSGQSTNRYVREPGKKPAIAEEYAIPMYEGNNYDIPENAYESVEYLLPDNKKTRAPDDSVTSKPKVYSSPDGFHKPRRDNSNMYFAD